MLFEKCLFTVIEKLVCDGGPFEGVAPVIRGENTCPHQDEKLYKYVVNLCKEKQSMWEPQGPHMTHMNVLDLAVFPVMPRPYSHLIQYLRGRRVANEEEI